MNRHPLDLWSLVAGAIFCAIGLTVLGGGDPAVWSRSGVWLPLLGVGAVAALVRLVRRRSGDGERS